VLPKSILMVDVAVVVGGGGGGIGDGFVVDTAVDDGLVREYVVDIIFMSVTVVINVVVVVNIIVTDFSQICYMQT